MEKFSFDIEDSWRAVGKIVSHATGEDVDVSKRFVNEWILAKKKYIDLLGPTGRMEGAVDVLPSLADINDEIDNAKVNLLNGSFKGRISRASLAIDLLYDLKYGCTLVKLGDIPKNALSEPLPDPRPEKAGKNLPAGTKVTKYVDLLAQCKGLGADERKFIGLVLSIAIGALKPKKYTVVLSVNPLDMLLASEHTAGGWRSCHALDGEYRTGPLAYMLDEVSVIAYAYLEWGEYYRLPGVLLPKKTWRQMVYFDLENMSALLSREYPAPHTALTREARRMAASVLYKYHNAPPKWKVRILNGENYRDDTEDTEESHWLGKKGGWHYKDSPVAWIRLPDGKPPRTYTGVDELICLKCGCTRDDGTTGGLLCLDCMGLVYCYSCDDLISGEVYEGPDGCYYCYDCYHDRFATCCECGDVHVSENMYYVNGEYYCDDCYHDIFTSCCQCGGDVHRDDALMDTYENAYCEYCFSHHTWRCDECGDDYPNDDDCFTVHDDSVELGVCERCLERRYTACTNCGEYYDNNMLQDGLCPDCYEIKEEMEDKDECEAISA